MERRRGVVRFSFHCLITSKCVIFENTLVNIGPICLSKRARTESINLIFHEKILTDKLLPRVTSLCKAKIRKIISTFSSRKITNLMCQQKSPFFDDLHYQKDLFLVHYRCYMLLKIFKQRTILSKDIYYELQSTIDDMIHINSGPVKLILLACLTIIDANVLIQYKLKK
jgi:hypothetical protein